MALRKKRSDRRSAPAKKGRAKAAEAEAPFFEIDDGIRIYSPDIKSAPDSRTKRVPAVRTDGPLPFADFAREILEEYRSDSSPTHYAMSVDLDEPEEASPDRTSVPEEDPFREGAGLFHSFLDDAEDRELPPDPPSGESTEAGEAEWDWMDIVREFKTEKAPDRTQVDPSPAGRGHRPMSEQILQPADEPVEERQPHIAEREPQSTASPADETQEAFLPAGIRVLTEDRLPEEPAPAKRFSLEDILAEYTASSGEAAQKSTVPAKEDAAPAGRKEAQLSAASGGRRSRLEAEARSLFRSGRLTERPVRERPETAPAPDAAEPELLLSLSDDPAPDLSFSDEEISSVPDVADVPAAPAKPSSSLRDRLPRRKKAEGKPAAVTSEDEKAPGADGTPDETGGPEKTARKKKRRPVPDRELDPAFVPDDDYEPEERRDSDEFPSFGQYLLGMMTGFWVRLRGAAPAAAAGEETMDAEEEDYGAELSPADASRYYGSYVRQLRLRFRVALVLWLFLLYISLGFPVTGMLRSIDVAAGMCLGLQLGMLLLSLDLVTGAAVNLRRGRFGADALTVLSCLLTCLDALVVLLKGFGKPHVPLCLISGFSLLGLLYASYLNARGLRKSLRVPAIGKRAYSVTAEGSLSGRSATLIKSLRPVTGFVRRSEEAAPDETAYCRAAPFLLIFAVVVSLVIVLVKKSASDYLYVLTAVLAPAVPATALLSYAMPFFIGSQRIFTSGAAIAGWSGLCDVGRSSNLIVTDNDLFPDDSVEIGTVRIFADLPSETVVSYAGTMICASGSGLAGCFSSLMERNGCPMRHLESFEYLPGGGLRGVIDGKTVLCGGMELMRLMNIRFPYRLIEKTSVLLAIDGVLCGIFNMRYSANPTVRRALVSLMRSNRHAVFAVRDFNVNPEMLHEVFDLATNGYDFPPYVDRFNISEAKPGDNRKIAAVLCREGLGSLVHMADSGRNMYLAVRVNLLVSLLSSVFGVLTVSFLLLSKGTVGIAALLLYALVWLVPVTLVSLFLRF